jgi:hypothetical protein
VNGQLHVPAALHPRKVPRYPLYRRLGGPKNRSARRGEEKIFDPTGTRNSDPSVAQPAGSRYTDRAIAAPYMSNTIDALGLSLLPDPVLNPELCRYRLWKYLLVRGQPSGLR